MNGMVRDTSDTLMLYPVLSMTGLEVVSVVYFLLSFPVPCPVILGHVTPFYRLHEPLGIFKTDSRLRLPQVPREGPPSSRVQV